ncbi:MAG: hypothetical protein ACYC91_07690 [Solirubrobacteraceae bacterium]
MNHDETTEPAIVDGELVEEDGSLVPAVTEVRALAVSGPVFIPAVQAAAVAATGFVAGAAAFALMRRRSTRRLARMATQLAGQRHRPDAPHALLPLAGSRTYLVNVRVIRRPGE